jgi:hypothetical protein
MPSGRILADGLQFFQYDELWLYCRRRTKISSRLTGNLDANLVPDSFQLSILDGNVNPLPTTDPSGSDAVLFAQFDQSSPVLLGYGSPAGAAFTLSTPVIDLKAIPEPKN